MATAQMGFQEQEGWEKVDDVRLFLIQLDKTCNKALMLRIQFLSGDVKELGIGVHSSTSYFSKPSSTLTMKLSL